MRLYNKQRIKFLSDNPICKVQMEYCTKEATTVHHKKGRIGSLLTDTKYFLPVCLYCHQFIEEHPAWAKENGFSLSRLSKE